MRPLRHELRNTAPNRSIANRAATGHPTRSSTSSKASDDECYANHTAPIPPTSTSHEPKSA